MQTDEERCNHTKARVSRWVHGNQCWGQIEGSSTRIYNQEHVWLARQQCSQTMDQRGWIVRNRVRITFVGETLERRTTLLISEAEVVIYSRPLWLVHQQQWPPDNVTCRTRETQAEATVIREVLAVIIQTNEGHDELMQKWDLWTTIRDEW